MAEFHGIFYHPFLMSILLIEGAGGMGGKAGWSGETGWGGMGDGKKSWLGHPWSSHEAHTMVHATLVGHGGSGSNPSSPSPNRRPPLVPLFQS